MHKKAQSANQRLSILLKVFVHTYKCCLKCSVRLFVFCELVFACEWVFTLKRFFVKTDKQTKNKLEITLIPSIYTTNYFSSHIYGIVHGSWAKLVSRLDQSMLHTYLKLANFTQKRDIYVARLKICPQKGVKKQIRKMGSFVQLSCLLLELWSLKCQKWLIFSIFC